MKYILKKEYPGSPKLGNTIDNLENDWIENYPEFWEKVVEKDYEILSLVCNHRCVHPGSIWKIEDYVKECPTVSHPNTAMDIYSVKRLSDGEIFTIDEVINTRIDDKYKQEILEISIKNNTIMFRTKLGFVMLSVAKKVKQPLFTTEDGIDIFEGDDYYHTDIKWKIHKSTNAKINSGNLIGVKGYNYFSTKEKAEEYILMNEPVLSLKDVASIYPGINKSHPDKPSSQSERLKNLVKSKIQQSV